MDSHCIQSKHLLRQLRIKHYFIFSLNFYRHADVLASLCSIVFFIGTIKKGKVLFLIPRLKLFCQLAKTLYTHTVGSIKYCKIKVCLTLPHRPFCEYGFVGNLVVVLKIQHQSRNLFRQVQPSLSCAIWCELGVELDSW